MSKLEYSKVWQHTASGGIYTIMEDEAMVYSIDDAASTTFGPYIAHTECLMESDLTGARIGFLDGKMIVVSNTNVARPCVVYMSLFDGQIWVRPHSEFHDGRFTNLWVDDLTDCRPAADKDGYQARVSDWVTACFGTEKLIDTDERSHRFLEEALELVQASGCTEADALVLVEYVYSRTTGDEIQEVGGVMVTLAALCSCLDIDMEKAGETELARVWKSIEKIREKQRTKPQGSPLPQ